jgi:hypothetical protein
MTLVFVLQVAERSEKNIHHRRFSSLFLSFMPPVYVGGLGGLFLGQSKLNGEPNLLTFMPQFCFY